MSEKHLDLEERNAFKEKAKAFFSEGALSEKIRLAQELASMPEVHTFLTALPWSIALSENNKTLGFSETFAHALKDMHAHLLTMAKTLAAETSVAIKIDEARLPHQRISLPLKTLEGG